MRWNWFCGSRRGQNFMPYMFMQGLKECSGEPVSQIRESYATSVRWRRRRANKWRYSYAALIGTVNRSGEKYGTGRAGREITTIARRQRADLVAVGTAGRTGIPYILLGSVAEHVMREA